MSRFLPDNFDASRPLALIAGQGNYPILACKKSKKSRNLSSFNRIGRRNLPGISFFFSQENERTAVKVGQVGKLLKELKRLGAGYAVMAGQVTPGKLFKGLHPDLKAIRMLAGLDRKNARDYFWCDWE